MMTDKEPLKITLEDLGEESPPVVPERPRPKVVDGAEQIGLKVAGAVKEVAGKVTAKVADTTTEAANRSAEAVRDKISETLQAQTKATADAVEQRIRDIDWKGEAQKGAEGGLRWLSRRLDGLAERLNPEDGQKPDPPAN